MRTNNKEVKQIIREHILDCCDNDIEVLKGNLKAVSHRGLQTVYSQGKELVQSGCFLCYYTDVNRFLETLPTYDENRKVDDEKNWELYKHLIGRECESILKEINNND
jgi:hypothetical protein